MAASSEPPYLPIGTDVSAKYRGAFCEAKVKKIVKSVKCRVFLKETQSSLLVTDEFITGPLQMGATVEVKHPDTGRVMEATIKQMSDSSMYTVVFDDADERTLRRTQLCLKGDKHFMESETLDNLPLSNPEHFGTPVISRGKRGRTSLGAGSQEESESSSEEEESPRKKYRGKNQELVGKVMFYETGERKKSQTLPVLVVLPDANPMELKNKDHLLVRSFKDGKYLSVACKELKNFTRETVLKNEDKSLKPAMEKALLYVDNRELPVAWNKEEMLGSDDEEVEEEEDSDEDDDEISEEKDRFVAQLYKFSDDRGTPINKGPSIGTKDLNLYKLFKVVQKYGGYNRVTNQMKWRLVYSKMQLPPSNTASTQIKNAYKKYLHAFEDFYRKLGSSMGTISRPSRSRNDSGRSLLSFRGREAARTPDKTDSDKEKLSEDTKSEFDSDAESAKLGTPKRPKSARVKLEKENKKVEPKEKESKEEKKTEKQEAKKDEKKDTKKVEDSPKKTAAKKTEEKKENKQQEPEKVIEKKGTRKKEDGSIKEKSDTEEELKDLQKKIGRRRSMKTEEKTEEDKEETKKDKKEDPKEKEREQKEKEREQKEKKDDVDTDKKKEEEKTEKKPKKKKVSKNEESSDMDTDSSISPAVNTDNLPVGSKLRVRYGKGKNTREYEAKVLEVNADTGPAQYLVHYQGWNNRHDEWVGRDRIMKVLERPDCNKARKSLNRVSPKPGTKGPRKKSLLDKAPASPSSVKSDSSISQGPGRPANKAGKSSASSSPSVPSAKPRPTRSNSIELITDGLPAKRRKRKVSSVYDSTNGSDSEDSAKSDTEMDTMEPEKKPEKSKTESPMKSTSMPSIASEKPEEVITEDLDSSIDRSPPKLMKQVDLNKEIVENEEKGTEKEQTKEEPLAPVLNVVDIEKSSDEPILQKLEAQLNSSSPASVEKQSENKEKETKKKEPERRGRKPIVKMDKCIESEAVKKVEKEKEEEIPKKEEEKIEESPYDFKDEPEIETEIRLCRKKANENTTVKIENKEERKPEIVTEVVNVLKGSLDDSGKELAGLALSGHLDEKDAAKSDSEVERRGRKRKVIAVKETVKPSVSAVSVNSVSSVVSSTPLERKPFVTLAEKKQGFSPMVRKVIPVPEGKAIVESAKILTDIPETDNSEKKEDAKKMPDLLVVHKAAPGKSDIVLGRKIESGDQDGANGDLVINEDDNTKEDESEVPSVKKKVRKKTKKKLEMEEQEMVTVVRKAAKRGPGRKSKEVSNKDKDIDSASASKDNSMDIDLRCEEQIRSRSASPDNVLGKSFVRESQGFVPRIETIDCRISDSQSSDNFSLKHDKIEKSQSVNKSNVFENTPPTTPEHDSDDAAQQNGHNDQINSTGKLSEEAGPKTDTSQVVGSESPVGNASPSNRSTGSSSGVIAGSEGSIDVPVYSGKRRRESDEPTPTKRRKRACRGKSTSSRTKQLADSDSEDFSKGRSPQYSSDSYQRTAASTSPRPPKYNFNLEEGKYLEGTDRIAFLVDKITEIRKTYMNLKAEVACIDRRRKKLRRKERERDAQSSSAVEVECS